MLDMRKLKNVQIHKNFENYINDKNDRNNKNTRRNNSDTRTGDNIVSDDSHDSDSDDFSVTIGTGFTWGEILKYLKSVNKDLITVHGQCTSVGVAGFALHGGVHFGGLSELYGLASDNILGLTAVIANSSAIELTATTCVIDGINVVYSEECRGLFFAFRGAGSSFGIVTSLTLKLHTQPKLFSALSILSLNIEEPSSAQKMISAYMENIPEEGNLFFSFDFFNLWVRRTTFSDCNIADFHRGDYLHYRYCCHDCQLMYY